MPPRGFNIARIVNGVFADACRCRVKCVFVHSLARLAFYGLPNTPRLRTFARNSLSGTGSTLQLHCVLKTLSFTIRNRCQDFTKIYQKVLTQVRVNDPLMCVAII